MKIRTLVITFALLCLVNGIGIAYIICADMGDTGYRALRNAMSSCFIMMIDIGMLTSFTGFPKGPRKDFYLEITRHNIFLGAIFSSVLTVAGLGLAFLNDGLFFTCIENIAIIVLTVVIALQCFNEYRLDDQSIDSEN